MNVREPKEVTIIGLGRTKEATAAHGDELITAKGSSQAQAVQKIAEKLAELGIERMTVDGFTYSIGGGGDAVA